MKSTFTILLILLLAICNSGAQLLCFTQSDISSTERIEISELMENITREARNIYTYQVDEGPSKRIGYFRCCSIEDFFKRMLVNNKQINEISLSDSIVTITFEPEFHQHTLLEALYHTYNDMYKALFAYEKVNSVSIVLVDGTNLTFLPTLGSDSWKPIENAILKKEWFIEDIDYVYLLGIYDVEGGLCCNEKGEYIAEIVQNKVGEYLNLIQLR
ncbi:MAG: hypothetical protein LIO77_03715 [Rikenellaceae bacterium]|nr:hypothetical protein [Rikenellaceae bacterium]